jgi:hypothetical protein
MGRKRKTPVPVHVGENYNIQDEKFACGSVWV